MRIRRNPLLPCMVAAAMVLGSNVYAQNTTGTATAATTATADQASTGPASSAGATFKLEPGDQLVYRTQGSVSMSAPGQGQSQSENVSLETSVTVLQKQGEVYTLYAAMSMDEETTEGTTASPGPRFTFEMPATGAAENAEFETAGFSGTVFPTFSMETLFAAPAAEGQTSVTIPLPFTNAPAEGSAVTSRDGGNLKTVTTLDQDGTTVMTRERAVSGDNSVTQSINTSATLSLSGRGAVIEVAIQDKTELVNSTKLSGDQLAALRRDVELAIPISAKLRTMNANSADLMKTVLEEVQGYLQQFPQGEFSTLFAALNEQLGSVVTRTANWEKIKEGEPAPEFSATTIDGKPIKLSDFKGKVVLIDFWATWCGPCIVELPNIKKLYDENKDKGFDIIGVSADEDIADLQQLVQQENLQWPQIFDGGDDGGDVQEIYGVMKYPTTVLVDKEGNINAVDLRGEQLEQAVVKLLGGE